MIAKKDMVNNRIACYFEKLKDTIDLIDINEIDRAVQLFMEVRRRGSHIFVLGNGGSAATANHFLCDFGKNAVKGDSKRFRVYSLCSSLEAVTAYANDISFDCVFKRQLINLMDDGDVILAISASGNSPNVIKAVQYARRRNAKVIGMTGGTGGKLKEMSDIRLHVESNIIEQVEDIHLIFAHIVVYLFKQYQAELVTEGEGH